MKRGVFTALFALMCTLTFAQVSFNVKAGLNLSSYIGENSENSEFKPGARIGLGMEYQFTDLISLQPSLFFSQKGAKYDSDYDGSFFDAKAGIKINQLYLELPVNVQFRFNVSDNTNILIATGPYFACGVGGKTKFDGSASIDGINMNGKDKIDTFGDNGMDFNRFDAGWNIGVGAEFGQFLVGLDTQLGFAKIYEGDAPHNANIAFTVGYKF
ncbi:MAG: porin family protein [Bacteroidales bacterium]